MPQTTPPTYWDYLALDRLLALQGGLDGDDARLQPDELHFIVVHQVYELWFKLILREVRLARDHLAAPRLAEETVPLVVHHLRRVTTIMELAVNQFRVMETLTPQDFLDFRDKLTPASGFQSFQMREMEILLGLDETQRRDDAQMDPLAHLKHAADASPTGAAAWARIDAVRAEPTLRRTLHQWLSRTPIQGSHAGDPHDDENVTRFLTSYLDAQSAMHGVQAARIASATAGDAGAIARRFEDAAAAARAFLFAEDVPVAERSFIRRVRAGLLFIESYRALPLLAWPRLLVDSIVELEEQLVLWRTRHARMVERTIGRRVGTGGSSGVDYLDATTRYRIFPELWMVRTLLLPRHELPALENAEMYGFAAGEVG
jgi:tryptophan 2,3-dioxygenase